MGSVLLIIHLMIAAALVGTVLLQRSEGGALGIGGGGGGGGFLSGRGAANMLTRTTALLAAAFFVTSIALTLINKNASEPGSILDKATVKESTNPVDALSKAVGKPAEAPAKPEAPTVPQSK